MINWSDYGLHSIARVAGMRLEVRQGRSSELWSFEATERRTDEPTPLGTTGKLAAESFAREWIAAQAAALGDGWISVEERLPEEYIRVLCRLTIGAGGTEGGWAVGSYAREFGWMTDGIPPQERCHYTTTHWRSLPPLPVAEVEE